MHPSFPSDGDDALYKSTFYITLHYITYDVMGCDVSLHLCAARTICHCRPRVSQGPKACVLVTASLTTCAASSIHFDLAASVWMVSVPEEFIISITVSETCTLGSCAMISASDLRQCSNCNTDNILRHMYRGQRSGLLPFDHVDYTGCTSYSVQLFQNLPKMSQILNA